MNAQSKLAKMKGKSFMYRLSVKKILDYKIMEKETIISTDDGIVSIKNEKLDDELEQFLPADSDAPQGLIKFGEDPNWHKLKTTAYSLIEKLNCDDGSKYIEQANAINSSIRSIVDLMKVEIEAAKVLKG